MTAAELIALPSDDAAEEAARRLTHCPACGDLHNPQGVGLLVCYRCFKTEAPNGQTPLKHSGAGFRDWLSKIHPL